MSNEWFVNEHVDAFALIIDKKKIKSPTLYRPLLCVSPLHWIYKDTLRSICVEHITKENVKNAEIILIPIVDKQHWMFLVAHLKEKKWRFYDFTQHDAQRDHPQCYTISSAEVGLKEDVLDDDRGHGFFESNPFKSLVRAAQWAQPITYLDIYECDSFTIGIFCLPTSSVIPLHDHPGMTVLSKILYGSMHVKAYDWVEPPCIINCGQRSEISVKLAKYQADTVLSAPCPTRVLYPNTGGNLHRFTAITSVAVLDVLAPPYSEVAGRRCTYYHDYPFSTFSSVKELGMDEREEDYSWLEAIEAPDNFYMRSGRYSGPPVKDLAL